ncbi:MAG: glycerol-3-phosphate 1-O-acyltransferase PlsY [Pyrinomonadaceae bacterium]
MQLKPWLLVVAAYLLGSIPFGYLIVRAKHGGDIRETGSGGTGATNVSRRAGKVAGVITLVLDALKGAVAVIVARIVLSPFRESGSEWVLAAAIAVMVGHILPVWLKFRGGKGVATGVGVFLILAPFATATAALVFVVVVLLTRYVSLGSILAALSVPAFVLLQHAFISPVPDARALMLATVVGALIIVFAHRANIDRLVHGNERKFR